MYVIAGMKLTILSPQFFGIKESASRGYSQPDIVNLSGCHRITWCQGTSEQDLMKGKSGKFTEGCEGYCGKWCAKNGLNAKFLQAPRR